MARTTYSGPVRSLAGFEGNLVGTADATQSTIVAVAGAANVSNITVTLKDVNGDALTGPQSFMVYSSSAADGLTLASAASTGYAVASGGVSLQLGAAITVGIRAMSSATGTCALTLTDTNKATSYLVLVLDNGIKISTQLTSGSYG